MYKQFIIDGKILKRQYPDYNFNNYNASNLILWQNFNCANYNFNYRYIFIKNVVKEKCYNIMDYCKGLKIDYDDCLDCHKNVAEVYHLDDIICKHLNNFKRNFVELNGALFATKQGLIKILFKLNFDHKHEVLFSIKTENLVECDDMRDKIESVLKHVTRLNENSEKFIHNHDTFKNDVNHKFEQFEIRLNELDTKLNTLQSSEKLKTSLQQLNSKNKNCVTFPQDVTKHQHLAVFSESFNDRVKLAFVSGQEQHFRKRKLQYENNMETLYDDVHPNPLLAIQCITENFYNKKYKIKKLNKRQLDVNCNVDVVKEIVNQILK